MQIITYWGVEIERVGRALALLVEKEDAQGGERLRHRTDVEPRVSLNRRAGCHVAQAVSLCQGDLSVGHDRHGDAGDLVLFQVRLQGLRDTVRQVGCRGGTGRTELAGGHEKARIENLGPGPQLPPRAQPGRLGRGRSDAGLGRRA